MEKKQGRAALARQTFIDAFCRLYKNAPFEKITVQKVSATSGYNRSTFYQYFDDMNDLLEAAERELIERLMKKRRDISIYDSSFIRELMEIYEENELYIGAMFGEYGSTHFAGTLKKHAPRNIESVDLANDKYLPYRMEYRLSGSISLFRLWLQRGKDIPMDEFIHFTMGLYR